MPNTKRCGCDCKTTSEFVTCPGAVQLPCCEHCNSAPCAYVIKWGCVIRCTDSWIPELMPLWRECLFLDQACWYSSRTLYGFTNCDTGSTVPNCGTPADSADYYQACCSLAKTNCLGALDPLRCAKSNPFRDMYHWLIPPVWKKTDDKLEYKQLLFDSCCYTPFEPGLVTSPGTGLCGMADYYQAEYPDWQYLSDVLNDAIVQVRLEITSDHSATIYGFDPCGTDRGAVWTYQCDDFHCADDSTFQLVDNVNNCLELPNRVCVSVYADNFRTPCGSGQQVCDCCDPGWASKPTDIITPECASIATATVIMERNGSLDVGCTGEEFTDPGGDCGYFVGQRNGLHFLEWCSGDMWHLKVKCCVDANGSDPCSCTDLGTFDSVANCSCPEGASPEYTIDVSLGTCCDCICTCSDSIPDTLYLDTVSNGFLFHCDPMDGKHVELTRTAPAPDQSWSGTVFVDECGTLTVTADLFNSDPCHFVVSIGTPGQDPCASYTTDCLACEFTSITGAWFVWHPGDPNCLCCNGAAGIAWTLSV